MSNFLMAPPLPRICQNQECGKTYNVYDELSAQRYCSPKCSTRAAWQNGVYANRPKRVSKKDTHRQIWVPKDKVIFVIMSHPLRAGDAEITLKKYLGDTEMFFHDKFQMDTYDAIVGFDLNSSTA